MIIKFTIATTINVNMIVFDQKIETYTHHKT